MRKKGRVKETATVLHNDLKEGKMVEECDVEEMLMLHDINEVLREKNDMT